MERLTVTSFIERHRPEILEKWTELWNSVQRKRPESHFPDPPYEAILAHLPFDPPYAPPLGDELQHWFNIAPIFCSGAAFCQLQAVSASILIHERYEERGEILAELENSLEAMSLEAGTRRWIGAVLNDTSKKEAVHAERLAVIGQLAAGVAHEIGNPLTSISAIVQVLERRTEDPFTTEQLQHVKKSIDRIARIVRELVDFSRPAPSMPAPVQVNDILATAIRLVQYDHRSRSITYDCVCDPALPVIHLVPDQILQVFLNLLINAIDAMNGQGRITVRTSADAHNARISIADSGHGIPADILPRIFDPFFTTKPMGKGTGLGLSVSYGIVKRYDGSIDVTSEPGVGSTFTIVLPYRKDTH